MLRKDNSVSIHHQNIQALATKMFKVKNKNFPITLVATIDFREEVQILSAMVLNQCPI